MTPHGAGVTSGGSDPQRPVHSSRALSAVRELASRACGRSQEIAQARALPADLVEDLRSTGILSMALPKELGGEEADPVEVLLAVEALATADGSLGWCAGIAVGTTPLGAYLPEQGARQVFPRPDVFAGGSFNSRDALARRVQGGFRVSGRWAFGSGNQHSAWMNGACVVVDETGRPEVAEGESPVAKIVFLPRSLLTIHDTWHVSGLEGTGSNDFSAEDVFVPAECTTSLGSTPWPKGALWRMPLLPLVFTPLAAVPLGIARAAIDELVRLADDKTPYRSSRRLAERDVAQSMVARAEAAVRSGRHFLLDAMAELRDAAYAGEVITMHQRAVLRLACVNAARAAVEATDLCYQAAGSTSLFTPNRLNRLWRDVHAAGQHVVLAYTGYETVGRVLFGLEADTPLL